MKAIELKLPDDVYQKLRNMASNDHQQVDEFALRKLEELVRAVDHFAELERRARQGSMAKFRAAMNKVPNGEPMAGDELPPS